MDNWVVKVKNIHPETSDTKTIFFERADGQVFSYQAGQFLTFLFSFQGRELRRSYSLSTTPGIDPLPAVTIKRVTNGEASRFLLDHLRVGDEWVTLPPAGRFRLEDAGRSIHCFIAAGSGMVPVFSLLKAALTYQPHSRVVLISQHHDEEHILFFDMLRQMEYLYPKERFWWVNLLSIRDGRLNNKWLEEWLDLALPEANDRNAAFYLCGPPAFMRMAQFTLRWKGFTNEQIKKENFTVEYVPPPPLSIDPLPKKITIHAGGQLYRFEAVWPVTILQAGLDQQIPLPYSCRGGRCSTCTAKCLSGEVKMSINEVLTEKDLRQGLVLTCVGYAATDVEISY